MLLLWQKRGLVSAVLATASYPSECTENHNTNRIAQRYRWTARWECTSCKGLTSEKSEMSTTQVGQGGGVAIRVLVRVSRPWCHAWNQKDAQFGVNSQSGNAISTFHLRIYVYIRLIVTKLGILKGVTSHSHTITNIQCKCSFNM